MKVELNTEQIKTLLEVIEDKTESTILKEIHEILVEATTNEHKINEFVDKYKYDNDNVFFSKGEHQIGLLIGAVDYHAHWSDDDYSVIKINNFIVHYKSIIDAKEYICDKNNVFRTDEEYKKMYDTFKKELSDIGVTCYEHDLEEYDALMVYSLPVNKILEDDFIEKYLDIVSSYQRQFKDELDLIYLSY